MSEPFPNFSGCGIGERRKGDKYPREHPRPTSIVEQAQTWRVRRKARVDEGGGFVLDLGRDFPVEVLLPGLYVVFVG